MVGFCEFVPFWFSAFVLEEIKMKKILSVILIMTLLITSLCFGINVSAATTVDGLYYTITDGEVTITGINGWLDCTNIVIPAKINGCSVTTIGNSAFKNNDNIESVTMSDNLISIESYAFYDCENLKTVKFSKKLKKIGRESFCGCEKLSNITIPKTVEYIDMFAFAGTYSLGSITIPGNTELMSSGEFTNTFQCSGITSVIFESGRSAITQKTFYQCGDLNTIYLPKSITEIKQDAFDECTAVTDVWYEGSSKDKRKIELEGGNSALANAKWHYNACAPTAHVYLTSYAPKCTKCGWVRKKYDYTINTDKLFSLEYSANCDFKYVISNKSIAKVTNISTSQISWGSYQNITKSVTISPLKPGAVTVSAVDKSGNVLTEFTVLINEGKHKMVTSKILRKATLKKSGKELKTCKYCAYQNEYAISKVSKFTLSTSSYTYNGKVKTPSVTVKDANGNVLKKGIDYTVTYASGRKNVGTYKVTVKMIGKYSGTKVLTFKINPAKLSSYKLSTTAYTYDGKAKTPSVTVKNASGTKLTKNTHYTMTYASGRKNVGTYKVTIKGKGNYIGTKTLTFKIIPAKTTISKLTAGKKSITVAITKKSTQVTGYQIQYSTSKTFSKATTKTISSYKTTKYTLKSLSAKKTYYVRVRTYKKVGSTTYYSGWSTYKYVKTK